MNFMKFQYRSFLLKEIISCEIYFWKIDRSRIIEFQPFFELFIHLTIYETKIYFINIILYHFRIQMRTKDLSPYFYPFQVVIKLIIDGENEEERQITTDLNPSDVRSKSRLERGAHVRDVCRFHGETEQIKINFQCWRKTWPVIFEIKRCNACYILIQSKVKRMKRLPVPVYPYDKTRPDFSSSCVA